MTTPNVWQSASLSQMFLEGVRAAIPLADVQLDVLLRVLSAWQPQPSDILDLGCGDGILGRTTLNRYPQAAATFVDFSDAMLEAAEKKLAPWLRVQTIKADFGEPDWRHALSTSASYDVIVSGFAIHHVPDERKRRLYTEIFDLLKPNGVFLNLEHVASVSADMAAVFDEYFIDSLYAFHSRQASSRSREQIAQDYYHRPDRQANILAPIEEQCNWLRQIGYRDVDCFFKIFELALFGGRK
jgi:tRNA (cmo5U34)-methyltransferase